MNDCVNEVEATRIMQDANQLVETDGSVGGAVEVVGLWGGAGGGGGGVGGGFTVKGKRL